jgi:hypothetical protein
MTKPNKSVDWDREASKLARRYTKESALGCGKDYVDWWAVAKYIHKLKNGIPTAKVSKGRAR